MNVDSAGFQYKYLDLEQYDYFDTDEIDNKSADYIPHIGEFLMIFSDIEWNLDQAIANVISDRSHQIGYQIILALEFGEKITLFNNLFLDYLHNINPKQKKSLKDIKKKLIKTSERRNVIAHANWMTLTKDSYIRTNARVDSDSGSIKFKYVKVTPEVLEEFIQDLYSLREQFDEFVEEANVG